MTITPRRAPSRASRARTRRPATVDGAGHAPAVRARARHAADPAAVPEVAAPAPVEGARKGTRRALGRRSYLGATVLRCTLYLGPLSVALAGGEALGQVAWPVPLATLLLGWTAAQALTCAGVTVARRAGIAAACRLVGAGFTAVGALWCALVWIAPDTMLGPQRWLALVVGLGGLATLATVTAALVTRAEAAVVCWCVPCWALAAAALAALAGHPVPELPIGTLLPAAIVGADHPVPGLPIGTLLPAAIVVALVRAFRPAMICDIRRPIRLTRPEARRAAAYLVIGASQAISVGLVWRAGPSGSTAPFWLPLLLAVPILEALIGWSTEAGPNRRGVTAVTLAGLLPPLALGVALAVLAARTEARAEVLALAGGTLLGGVFAVTYLLAARGRTGIAATMAIALPLLTVALKILPLPAAGPLPDAVGALAVTHLAGLLAVALTAADHPESIVKTLFPPYAHPSPELALDSDTWIIRDLPGERRAAHQSLGRIDLDWGSRSLADVLADVDAWRADAVEGLFLDRAQAGSGGVGPVALTVRLAARRGLHRVVLNPGVPTHPLYRDLGVRICTFEGPWAAYRSWDGEGVRPGDGHIVHGVPPALLTAARRLMGRRGAGFGLATDARPYTSVYAGDAGSPR